MNISINTILFRSQAYNSMMSKLILHCFRQGVQREVGGIKEGEKWKTMFGSLLENCKFLE